ncbi:MAG: hypothetical protein GWM92_19325, partial [Gemmatimonadetes bacterium]|nr:DUF4382 domain-containing protein [Gemmatimonadota bacterium]NIR80955.1 DUF4382 domain-containing protein [Gemmatimonadota bacterium]NIT89773.1 DUF4382 domain-containing protein [Gemmatimonadota bacterium]NIU33559.1 DUF4382 domain-containing protein [Gemmatimonadota bacterium]NIU37828.1 hypothetical protein [Gemmatimonadota bacterium]
LTRLATETATLVDELAVDPGTFTGLSLVVGGAVLETTDGAGEIDGVFTFEAEHPEGEEATGVLLCPACGESGFEVLLPGPLEVGDGDNGLVLDFDVTRSFGRRADDPDSWTMEPVITGAPVDPEAVRQGARPGARIVGTVVIASGPEDEPIPIPECPAGEERDRTDFIPIAATRELTDDEGEPLAFSGETGPEGSYEITVLLPDVYELDFVARRVVGGGSELVFEATATPEAVTVGERSTEETGGTFTIGSAACEPPP